MGDQLPTVKVAVVQAASYFLDREGSTNKAVDLIDEAGREGAEVVVFPEGFIPTHPVWFHFHSATSRAGLDMAADLFRNSVVLDGPEVAQLVDAARRNAAWVVIGVCEKRSGTTGTMWNTALHLSPDGTIAAAHRKLTPTVGERLVHTGGGGQGLKVPVAPFGPISSLICAENSNPLLIFSALAQYPVLHASLWPSHFSPTQPTMRRVIQSSSRALAYQAGSYVLSAAGTLDEETIIRVGKESADFEWLRDPENLGGSCIVAPNGETLAGPAGAEETILYAQLDLDRLIDGRAIHDYAGHYNRPDVLGLSIRDTAGSIFEAPWGAVSDLREVPLDAKTAEHGLEGEGAGDVGEATPIASAMDPS